ncbi:hydroxymethylglutaryl-CoA synthase [Shewanella nanhaiensis]|uniref:Hydroxymethylglutaryl-CoA synthase n=1 Tax=Shewanella nanhaiensis TaxID=2864872 RepID=A0ABS7E1L0_9GAMM|nr:hydroxymethylglutaryl-CoA synthase [Shewanella nanhaiensis]MBW8183528.1 hydroxymethylglutaryl-CoA synthase [Shewanella nanhaiensis]
MNVGIDSISLCVPESFYPLTDLAEKHGIDPNKYLYGLGQEKMSVPSPDEDIVTLAAGAANPILTDDVRASISTVILATESGIDQSKSAGLFVHGLLGIKSNCRVIEFKQACYGATAALQMATDMVRQRPDEKILIIASDIARYEQDSLGECTQGAGALAMVISANPRLLNLHHAHGTHSFDVMDFWRPNGHKAAQVDGHLSIEVYLESMRQAWSNYKDNGGHQLSELPWLCFHQPFTKMSKKAFTALKESEPQQGAELTDLSYEHSLLYGRQIGNTYTASLYIGLLSLLENNPQDLTEQNIGLFSYGSGSVGEFFSAQVVPGYRQHLRVKEHQEMLSNRQALSHEKYTSWFYQSLADHENQVMPKFSNREFRLEKVDGFRRVYGVNTPESNELKKVS